MAASINLVWGKSGSGSYYKLVGTDFSALKIPGVYFIFGGGKSVKIGQSIDLASRLSTHQKDASILGHAKQLGDLYVTWARVSQSSLDGVERFLAESYRPLIGDRFPDVLPMTANLPQ